MINLEKAKKEFENYTSKFDLNEQSIKRKVSHTFRVEKQCESIANSLKLNNEEVKLAKLIGILHDIARFEQYTQYKTYKDADSFNHGDYGVEILNKDIRNYIDTDEYDKIIKCAVKNHNKYKIEEGLSKKEKLFCDIVRDADKLDILYEILAIFWKEDKDKPNVEYSKISNEVMNQIMEEKPVMRKIGDDDLVKLLCTVAFVFDINFEISLEIIKNENYINNMLNSFDFKEEETKKQIELIKEKINNYIDKRLKK